MKRKFKYYILMFLVSLFISYSCSEDYLNVADPTVLSESVFPQTVDDLDPILVDIYGRLQDGYNSIYHRNHILRGHSADHGYNGAEFNENALNTLNADMRYSQIMWNEQYLAIGKINGFFETITKMKEEGDLSDSDLEKIDQKEGQARFLRALNYYYLVNLFGETPILTEADKNTMGVPIWTEVPKDVQNTSKPRATQGEVFDQIISDLVAANNLLSGVVFEKKSHADEWAVKSLLGKAYIYSLQWSKAKEILKDVINNSGKELLSYDDLHNKAFHGNFEFHKESIFEVNYTPDKLEQSEYPNTGNRYPRYVSVTWIDDTGKEITNGFGNLFVHDKNISRFGIEGATSENQQDPTFISYSKQVREDKSVDPRLFVSTFQPYFDSIYYDDGNISKWRRVGKSREESYNSTGDLAWNHSKYTIIHEYWRNQQYSIMNMMVLRLADIYLLYAEACMHTSDADEALEYINKVHRRAYDQPVNVPSVYDYTSLSDRTTTVDSSDPLANDPLKYERWAELFDEANWWLDVRRFDLGAEEAAYYEKVKGGSLEWADWRYATPIPTLEINSNSEIIQNSGY